MSLTKTDVKHYDAVLSLRRRHNNNKKQPFIGEGVAPDLRIDSVPITSKQFGIKSRHFSWATCFVVATTLFYMYPIIVVMLNAKFPADYMNTSPRVFVTSQYGYEWWILCIMSWNILLPYTLALALVNNNVPEWASLHSFLSRTFSLLNLVLFLMLCVDWLFLCNNGFVPWSTLCNDPRYCCVYFGSSQLNMEWCPNGVPCTPDVSGSSLYRSDEFFQLWLFSLFFWLLSFSNNAVNIQLARFGFFRESVIRVPPSEVTEGDAGGEGGGT